jgi:hypothetical protein
MVSTTSVGDERWIRMVAANPNADVVRIISCIQAAVLDKRGSDLSN